MSNLGLALQNRSNGQRNWSRGHGKSRRRLICDDCEEGEESPVQKKFTKVFTRNLFPFSYCVRHTFDVGKFFLQNECIFMSKYFIRSLSVC